VRCGHSGHSILIGAVACACFQPNAAGPASIGMGTSHTRIQLSGVIGRHLRQSRRLCQRKAQARCITGLLRKLPLAGSEAIVRQAPRVGGDIGRPGLDERLKGAAIPGEQRPRRLFVAGQIPSHRG